MKICIATLASISPYSQSRMHDTPKLDKENAADYEERTWKNKAHVDGEGLIFIPPMALKQAIDAAAKFLSIQIPGKGKATYTKHFRSGLLIMDAIPTGLHIDQVQKGRYQRQRGRRERVRQASKARFSNCAGMARRSDLLHCR